MKRNSTRTSFANPFLMWAALAVTTAEMMMASAQVIGHRTGRLAVAGPLPSEPDCREFSLMGHEKFEVAAESAQAMTTLMLRMNTQLGARAMNQMLTGIVDLMSIAASTSVAEAIERHAKLIQTLTHSAATASQIVSSSARLAQRGLAPIHSRATANAKRLGNV